MKTTAETLGLKSSDAALQQLRKDQKAALAAAQEKLLGPEGWESYRQYQRVLGVRDEITEITSLAAFTDTPFSAKQSERLLFVVAEMSESYRKGGRADFFTVDWDAVLAQASGFLAEPQMEALRAHAQGRRMVHRLTQFYIKRGHKY